MQQMEQLQIQKPEEEKSLGDESSPDIHNDENSEEEIAN